MSWAFGPNFFLNRQKNKKKSDAPQPIAAPGEKSATDNTFQPPNSRDSEAMRKKTINGPDPSQIDAADDLHDKVVDYPLLCFVSCKYKQYIEKQREVNKSFWTESCFTYGNHVIHCKRYSFGKESRNRPALILLFHPPFLDSAEGSSATRAAILSDIEKFCVAEERSLWLIPQLRGETQAIYELPDFIKIVEKLLFYLGIFCLFDSNRAFAFFYQGASDCAFQTFPRIAYRFAGVAALDAIPLPSKRIGNYRNTRLYLQFTHSKMLNQAAYDLADLGSDAEYWESQGLEIYLESSHYPARGWLWHSRQHLVYTLNSIRQGASETVLWFQDKGLKYKRFAWLGITETSTHQEIKIIAHRKSYFEYTIETNDIESVVLYLLVPPSKKAPLVSVDFNKKRCFQEMVTPDNNLLRQSFSLGDPYLAYNSIITVNANSRAALK